VATPAQADVWVGLDASNGEHFADALEGNRHNAVLICLARRRCDAILAMFRTHQPGQPARHTAELAEAA
jgi:hypothetical protein